MGLCESSDSLLEACRDEAENRSNGEGGFEGVIMKEEGGCSTVRMRQLILFISPFILFLSYL